MEQRLLFNFDLPELSRKATFAFWLVTTLFVIFILLDWIGSFIQSIFPFIFGTPKVVLFEGLKDRAQAISYEPYEKAFLSRNLWQKSEDALPTAPLQEFELDRLELTGIFLGKEKKALFRDTQTRQSRFLKAGDSIGPYTIQEIHERTVIVRSGTVKREIRVRD